ncbi:MAG TPA: DUF2892 domain-containing protein [Thermodesulfobacteriota bacterium]|nr:DUF2892 domain-containing protein [Thermodesulfobacteriota bacterium]
MTRNVCRADRAIRAALGLGVLSLVVAGPETWWGLLGIVPLGTALAGYCPLYRLLGVSTCRVPT